MTITTSKWERLSIKKGYKIMREHGLSKPKSAWESVKGIKVLTIYCVKQ